MDKSQQLKKIQDEYQHCQRCPVLVKNRTQVVFGSGNSQAEVLLIGEAPGVSEDKQGIPFCGMSGKILDDLLKEIGLTRAEIFITNTILCRPPDNRNPAKEEVKNCSDRLETTIEIIKPKVIVTIGNSATERILGRNGVKTLHGKIFTYRGIKVVPVIHPANYLYSGRNPELLKQMKTDFQTVAKLLSSVKQQQMLSQF